MPSPTSLPDRRDDRGLVHPLPAVLGLVALALLMGRKSLKGIARFGRQHGPAPAHAVGFRRGKTPPAPTPSRTPRRLDAEQVEAIWSRRIHGRIEPAAVDHIWPDGKVPRGSRGGAVPGHHLVAAHPPAVTAVLAPVRVDAETNEHEAAPQRLGRLPSDGPPERRLAGEVAVGDAMARQRDVAERVVDAGGDYAFAVKGNRPGFAIDIEAGFGLEHAARGIAAATSH